MQINLFTNGKTNTKSVMKASISLAVAAMLLTAALAMPAAAQKQVPFKGSLQGHETDTPEGGPPPHNTKRRWECYGDCYARRSILIHLSTYGEPRERHRNRVCSLGRGQRRQHRYDSCRVE